MLMTECIQKRLRFGDLRQVSFPAGAAGLLCYVERMCRTVVYKDEEEPDKTWDLCSKNRRKLVKKSVALTIWAGNF